MRGMDMLDAELHDVEWLEDYREQRFYPLKQVVDIFSSGDPEGLTLEVREPSCWPAPSLGRAWGRDGGSHGDPTSSSGTCLLRYPRGAALVAWRRMAHACTLTLPLSA